MGLERRSYLPMNSKGDASMTGIVKVLLELWLEELLPGLDLGLWV